MLTRSLLTSPGLRVADLDLDPDADRTLGGRDRDP